MYYVKLRLTRNLCSTEFESCGQVIKNGVKLMPAINWKFWEEVFLWGMLCGKYRAPGNAKGISDEEMSVLNEL